MLYAVKLKLSTLSEHTEKTGEYYTLPWPHYTEPLARRAPLLHRLAGQFLLHRGSKLLGSEFSTTEFLLGVGDAVKGYASVLNERRYQDLETMFSPSLYKAIDSSLHRLPVETELIIDVTAIKGQTLCSVNTTIGDANPGDEHAIKWLGQTVLTSKSRMMEIFEGESRFTYRDAHALGTEATLSRLKFVLGVSFLTRACFKVVDSTGQILQGHDQYIDEFHYWKFTSLVDYDREYPFEWIVVDINNFMHNSQCF